MFTLGERVFCGAFSTTRGMTICLLVIFALVSFASCESSPTTIQKACTNSIGTAIYDPAKADVKSVSRIVEEIVAFEPDEYSLAKGEIDPLIFELLKSRLTTDVQTLSAGTETTKLAMSAPTGNAGLIDDLSYDDGTNTITWSYVNVGDYDSSGEVGVPDITPIAQNYLADTMDGQGDDILEAWIDGDGDGEVGISDITPIAQGYLNNIAHYDILTCDTIDGEYSFIASIDFAATGEIPQEISTDVPAGTLTFLAVQPTDALGNPGDLSMPVEVAHVVPGAPQIVNIEPTTGGTGSEVEFIAFTDGFWLFDFSWDFGGGASPDTSIDKMPVVTLGSPGIYSASLTLTNSYGETTYDFTLTVTDANEPPVANLVANDAFGPAPLNPVFIASGSTDSDGTIVRYDWDTDADGVFELTDNGDTYSPTYTEFETYQVGVRVTDDDGATSYVYETANLVSEISDDLGEYGTSCAFARVNGNPALVYTEASAFDSGTMYYVRSLDTEGETWGTPVEITSAGFPGSMSGMASLATIDGNPAIAYFCETSSYPSPDHGLFYVRANDADGAGWGAPMRVDDAYRAGTSPTLFVVGGYPAIGYQRFDSTDFKVFFVHGNDVDGVGWGSPVEVDTVTNTSGSYAIGPYMCATDIGGCPGLLYCLDRGDYTDTTTEVRFARASDAAGTSWGEPVTLYSAGQLIDKPFLLYCITGDGSEYPFATFLVDDNPDSGINDFKAMNLVATDKSGTTWLDIIESAPPGSRSPSGLARVPSDTVLEGAQLIKTVDDSYVTDSYTAKIYATYGAYNATIEAHCEAAIMTLSFFGGRKHASKVVKMSHFVPGYVIKVEADCSLEDGIYLTAVITYLDYSNRVRVATVKEWDFFRFDDDDDDD